MNFPTLNDTFDGDAAALRQFSSVLERELTAASEEVNAAFRTDDAQRLRDIRHKLKTSLSILEATDLAGALHRGVKELAAGRGSDATRRTIVEGLASLTERLKRENW